MGLLPDPRAGGRPRHRRPCGSARTRRVDETDLEEARSPSATALTPHDWPVAFHGAIGGRGDADAFAINAHAGDAIQVEAFAGRIGSPLDTVLEVYDPEGDLVACNDDDASHDSRLVFRAGIDGTYRIEIRDKRGEGGPGFLYRVEVEPPRPSLTLFLAGPVRKSQARQVIAVPRGNRVVAFLGVRRDGFDDPVQIDAGSLPRGVSFDLKAIPTGTYLTPVVIEAAADAPLGAALVELKGVASTANGTVSDGFRQVVDLVPGSGDSSYESLAVGSLAVVVTEAAPYAVSLSTPGTPLARDGAIDLIATVERSKGFDEAVEVSLPYLPPGVEMDGPGIVPPGRVGGHPPAVRPVGRRPGGVAARRRGPAGPAPPRSPRYDASSHDPARPASGRRAAAEGPRRGISPGRLAVRPARSCAAPVSGRLEAVAVEQGKTVTVICTLEPVWPPGSAAVATLEGLPPRAEAAPVEVAPGARRVEFRVAVATTTPAGEHETLSCRLTSKVGGREFAYRIGRGGQLKVYPPGLLTTGADGKPLSPLDALRLKLRGEANAARERTPEARPPGPR